MKEGWKDYTRQITKKAAVRLYLVENDRAASLMTPQQYINLNISRTRTMLKPKQNKSNKNINTQKREIIYDLRQRTTGN